MSLICSCGGLIEYQMNGATVVGSAWVSTPGAGFKVVGSGDYNGDGKTDILLQNSTGVLWEFQMYGTTISGNGEVTSASTDWGGRVSGDLQGSRKI